MQLLNNRQPGSALQQIDIRAVSDDVLVLSGNRYRLIFETSSLNLELRSEEEQDALIEAYRNFLNSLNTPLQIIVRVREIDLDDYLASIERKLKSESERVYRDQLVGYAAFVRSLINSNRILSRSFYVVVPYDAPGKSNNYSLNREQLIQRADIVSKGLQRLGMHVRQLNSVEILDLFYSFYNPLSAKLQPLTPLTLRLMHSVLIREVK